MNNVAPSTLQHPVSLERVRKYLAAVPPAVSGSGGDAATYRAAVALVKGFDLGPDKAYALLEEWNARCSPPWSERDLRAKLASAAKSPRPAGYLLQRDHHRPARTPAVQVVVDAAHKEYLRARWPDLLPLESRDVDIIASDRDVSTEAVRVLAGHDSLRVYQQFDGLWCYVIHSFKFAQARRMDGKPFVRKDGSTVKALNLPGSEGSFLEAGGLGERDRPVLLTEGAISLLESVELVLRARRLDPSLPQAAHVAAISAHSRFSLRGLATMAKRRVRILADADDAGKNGAAAWCSSLRGAGCTVDCLLMPGGFKDLGDALREMPADDPCWKQLLTF